MRYLTKRHVMKSWISMLLILGLAGCAQAPEGVVVKKDVDRLVEKATQEIGDDESGVAFKETYSVHMKSEDTGDNLTYDITAEEVPVLVPEKGRLPMFQTESGEIPQEMAKRIFDYFFPDGDATSYTPGEMTKSEISERLLGLKEELVRIENMEAEKGEDGEGDSLISSLQSQIDYLTALYAQAPESSEGEYFTVDGSYRKQKTNTSKGIVEEDILECGQGDKSLYIVSNPADHVSSSKVSFMDVASGYSYGEGVLSISAASETGKEKLPDISKEEAERIGKDFFEKIGLETELFSIEPVRGVKSINSDPFAEGEDIKIPDAYTAWRLVYSHIFDGYQTAVTAWNMIGENVSLPWSYERIELIIEPSGIVKFDWIDPLTKAESVSEKTNIISFEKACEIFENMQPVIAKGDLTTMAISNEYLKLHYDVEKVSLELIRIRKDGNQRSGYLLPAWVFYGSKNWDQKYFVDTLQRWVVDKAKENEPYIIMAVNGVDGSIINLSEGY